MKLQKYISILLDIFIMFCLLIFFASAGFQDNLVNGWYQQYLPEGITNNINSLVFTDSLTGYIATANNTNAVSYILKTTNGGDNWFILIRDSTGNIYNYLKFFNKDTAFLQRYDQIIKTTNAGLNWSVQCNLPGLNGFYALTIDTIFCIDQQSIIGGFWRTTNGGTSWAKLVNFGSGNPSAVYFYNKDIGFIVRSTDTYKTTDGGFNWSVISGGGFKQIFFLDSLTGFKANGDMKKTTDGGLNWVTQQIPSTDLTGITKFSIINRDTIWGSYGSKFIEGGYRGLVYKTTNGGTNWGYQVPLNNNNIDQYFFIAFSNKLNGWAYWLSNTGVHTKIGGSDTTIFTNINSNIISQSERFILYQNYPNPFNPITSIKYEIKKEVKHQTSNVKLIVFDITGKQVNLLVNDKKKQGSYEVIFNGNNLSSGIYFYSLFVNGDFIDTKKMMLIK